MGTTSITVLYQSFEALRVFLTRSEDAHNAFGVNLPLIFINFFLLFRFFFFFFFFFLDPIGIRVDTF